MPKFCVISPGKSGTTSFHQFCLDKGLTCDHNSNMKILIDNWQDKNIIYDNRFIINKVNKSNIDKVISLNSDVICDTPYYWKEIWTSNPYYKKSNKKWTKGWVLEINNRIVGCLCIFPMIYDFLGKSYVVTVATAGVVEKQYNTGFVRTPQLKCSNIKMGYNTIIQTIKQ